MQIQLSTDHTIEGRETMATSFSAIVEASLQRFAEHITNVEIRLSDENAGKTGPDEMRCMIEALLSGRPPLVVTSHAETLDKAVGSAAHKMSAMIEGTLGRQRDLHRRSDAPVESESS